MMSYSQSSMQFIGTAALSYLVDSCFTEFLAIGREVHSPTVVAGAFRCLTPCLERNFSGFYAVQHIVLLCLPIPGSKRFVLVIW